ncbi:hypothetical protein CcaverHIS002_0402030 [Cutaneotrichosporon cavernicola]|uniref:Phosphoribulokinase/uridine kinase domain-containing protein n=1 Tax=Cutaneotrichosporon cavernicola TaxID=279322 RepID=A0AA48QVI6_9TREE|nr:uncharacterized protein CcaverHIS019_0401990 [Cutaneotrichosporon cavernicola]BEI83599.1 hypothetical protein CcaverHIS002_0402030 [Cutaneotrichosporon cavernicola]BEI91379.1 hypothetical protein CcaverHIS019_0401990 [Cutaneotrichosporon cavernicola]BEI99153.1 hypothetical protein CcaverHIS631_0401960 [Cutaneotrichosporon cavernicola]BEJ06929.1 hypothetical protein CcaverHIS641_0401980 [Cutaneotrichosporon cavernicola]
MITLDIDSLAQRIIDAATCHPERRYIVAIGGIPGSGKSTVAYPLVDRINALAGTDVAMGLGTDGWHYSQAQLRAMNDSEMLFRRRGAHFTFDGLGYESFVRTLDEPEVQFPSFSHCDKDPVADGGWIRPQHRIVVIEGLHSLLDKAPWSTAALRYDEKVWVDTPIEVARDRIIRRHLNDGVEATLEAATRRAEGSDLLNARTLRKHVLTPTVVVQDTVAPPRAHVPIEASKAVAA